MFSSLVKVRVPHPPLVSPVPLPVPRVPCLCPPSLTASPRAGGAAGIAHRGHRGHQTRGAAPPSPGGAGPCCGVLPRPGAPGGPSGPRDPGDPRNAGGLVLPRVRPGGGRGDVRPLPALLPPALPPACPAGRAQVRDPPGSTRICCPSVWDPLPHVTSPSPPMSLGPRICWDPLPLVTSGSPSVPGSCCLLSPLWVPQCPWDPLGSTAPCHLRVDQL